MANPISISINIQAQAAQAGNFGTPAIFEVFAATIFPERWRTYTSLPGVLEDFPADHPVTARATQLFLANPRPANIVVFRLIGDNDQVHVISGSNIQAEREYSFYVNGETFSYVAQPSDAWSDVAAGLSSSFAADATTATKALLDVTEDGTDLLLNVNTTGDKVVKWVDAGYSPDLTFTDSSDYDLDGGWVAQLNELANNGPAFFSFTIGSLNSTDILAAAGWAETREKLFFAQTKDSDVLTSATDDVGSTLQDLGYSYTAPVHSRRNGLLGNAASALVAKPAGSLTWKFKGFTGLLPEAYSANDKANLIAKKVNYITTNRGTNTFTEGTVASGRFVDETRDLSFFRDLLEVALLNTFLANDGIPYTEEGFVTLESAFTKALSQAEGAGIFDTGWKVTFPSIASIPSEQRALREIQGVVVEARLAGKVHSISVAVNVSF